MVAKGRAAHNKANAKITQRSADIIRTLYPTLTQVELAKRYKLSKAQICRIVNGERWQKRDEVKAHKKPMSLDTPLGT